MWSQIVDKLSLWYTYVYTFAFFKSMAMVVFLKKKKEMTLVHRSQNPSNLAMYTAQSSIVSYAKDDPLQNAHFLTVN